MATSLSDQLDYIQTQIALYGLSFIYVLGIVGNLINTWIFSRRGLRSNGCSLYFVCMSLVHFVLLNVVCLSRIIVVKSHYDAFGYIIVLCKLRSYFNILSIALSRHFLCLIAIDRWLVSSSNAWLRKLSSSHIALRVVIGSIIFWALFSIHALIGYAIPGNACRPEFASIYGLFYSIYAIVIAIVPLIIISIFSIMTVINVRKSGRRILAARDPVTNHVTEQQHKRRKKDMQLIFVSLIQVILYLLLNLLVSIWPLYVYLLQFQGTLSSTQSAINLFINYISTYLMYTYAAVSKYLIVNTYQL